MILNEVIETIKNHYQNLNIHIHPQKITVVCKHFYEEGLMKDLYEPFNCIRDIINFFNKEEDLTIDDEYVINHLIFNCQMEELNKVVDQKYSSNPVELLVLDNPVDDLSELDQLILGV